MKKYLQKGVGRIGQLLQNSQAKYIGRNGYDLVQQNIVRKKDSEIKPPYNQCFSYRAQTEQPATPITTRMDENDSFCSIDTHAVRQKYDQKFSYYAQNYGKPIKKANGYYFEKKRNINGWKLWKRAFLSNIKYESY